MQRKAPSILELQIVKSSLALIIAFTAVAITFSLTGVFAILGINILALLGTGFDFALANPAILASVFVLFFAAITIDFLYSKF